MNSSPLHEIAARINEGDEKGAWAVLLVFLYDLMRDIELRSACRHQSEPERDVAP